MYLSFATVSGTNATTPFVSPTAAINGPFAGQFNNFVNYAIDTFKLKYINT